MSILYKLYPIKDTINKPPKEGLLAKAVSRGTVNVEMLAKEISKGTTFNEAEIQAVIIILVQLIESNLAQGYTVNLGNLGSFFVSAQSRIVSDENEIRSSSVKVKRITYKPSRKLTKNLKGAIFERSGKMIY